MIYRVREICNKMKLNCIMMEFFNTGILGIVCELLHQDFVCASNEFSVLEVGGINATHDVRYVRCLWLDSCLHINCITHFRIWKLVGGNRNVALSLSCLLININNNTQLVTCHNFMSTKTFQIWRSWIAGAEMDWDNYQYYYSFTWRSVTAASGRFTDGVQRMVNPERVESGWWL